jgi:conjugal transfer pilus assembly protein TraE
MKLNDFLTSWESVHSENRIHRMLILGLLSTNILTGIAVLRTDRTVVLLPPALQKEVEISRREASSSLKESWALYLAELLGNVTPANGDFIEKNVAPLLAPGIYREVTEALSEQIRALKVDRVAVSFKPKQVFYEAETDKIFVTGDHVTQGPNSHPEIRGRTYEFRILFKDYRPLLDSIDVYADEPRTLEHQKVSPPVSNTTKSTS